MIRNIRIEQISSEVIIFDSAATWAHNEADLGGWRAPRYKMDERLFEEFKKQMGVSESKDDWDDQNALYAIRYDLLVLAPSPGTSTFLNMAIEEMRRLIEDDGNIDFIGENPDGFTMAY